MNRVAVLLFAAVLVIAVYAIVAFAQPGMMGGRGGATAVTPESLANSSTPMSSSKSDLIYVATLSSCSWPAPTSSSS